ncbi:MAG: hypothetical protein BWY90_00798 [Deltaproteobacteria bacterium ADurb.BinA014]|nr:MAG: hypothetical protein BWY90_00798 [Deltaproteobacteria bacterium ADurb.BinA014]
MWEILTTVGNDVRSDRQKVRGGWIVRKFKTDQYGKAVNRDFVSDPNHQWKVYKEPVKTKKTNL